MSELTQAFEAHKAGRVEEAETSYREILRNNPAQPETNNLLGLLLLDRKEHLEAVERFSIACSGNPDSTAFKLNYAECLAKLERWEESERVYREACEQDPEDGMALAKYGLFFAMRSEWKVAEPLLSRSVDLIPNEPALRINYGNTLRKLGKLDLSIASFRKAIELAPEEGSGFNCLGEALEARGQSEEALRCFEKANERAPDDATILANLGLAYHRDGQLSKGISLLKRACAIRPGDASSLASLGAAMRDACRAEAGFSFLDKAVNVSPNELRIVSKFLYSLNFMSDLEKEDVERAHLFSNACFSRPAAKRTARRKAKGEVLRVGFVSADFCAHSVAYFLLPLFVFHERSRAELFCYAEGALEDSVSGKFRERCTGWRSILGCTTEEVARVIEADEIDALIDVSGHTAGARLDVMREAKAYLKLSWLGYPNKVGLDVLDGRIVDGVTDPEANDSAFGEENLRLGGCFLSYASPFELPKVEPSPYTMNGYVTFGSFNNGAKMNDSVIESWSAILNEVKHSRLVMKSWQFGDEDIQEDLRSRFAMHGISGERIEFLPRLRNYTEHMASYGRLDIALDTFPYNGTTTTCEALWMGVPVVCFEGDRHASRVGKSILIAAGMSDWVATDRDQYVRFAVDKANRIDEVASGRLGMRSRMENSNLGDVEQYAGRFFDLIESRYFREERRDDEA